MCESYDLLVQSLYLCLDIDYIYSLFYKGSNHAESLCAVKIIHKNLGK